MRARGMGMVYKRGKTWWVKYWFRGAPHRESSGSTIKQDAVDLLKQRQREMGLGRIGREFERVTFEDLAKLLEEDYTLNGRKSIARVRQALVHLRQRFGLRRAMDITPAAVSEYIKARLGDSAAPATVRHEVSFLSRAFSLAYRAGLVASRPPFPGLNVRNTRTGFFEEGELRAVLAHLPQYLQAFVECAHLTGWRRAELCSLSWRQVDFKAGTLRLEPGETKNDEGRVFPFASLPRLAELLMEQRRLTVALERGRGEIVPWVFHREGRPVGDYREAWRTACRKAGVPGKLIHDLRRTAVRNLERAGVPRSFAMKLTGHKTESVYRRYAIVSEADLTTAVQKLATLHAATGTGPRTVIPISDAVETSSGTVRAQSGHDVTDSAPQAVVAHHEDWRPQRDSKTSPGARPSGINGHNWPTTVTMRERLNSRCSRSKPMVADGSSTERAQSGRAVPGWLSGSAS